LLGDQEVAPMGTMGRSNEACPSATASVLALDGLDLEVAEGEVVGYLGPTGRQEQPPFACCSG